MNKKQTLGQFYTTHYEYILQGFSVPNHINHIIEPFAVNVDLLKFIENKKYSIECYDIEPKQDFITTRDTLTEPPDYNNKFIITNPPLLNIECPVIGELDDIKHFQTHP